MHVTSEGEQVRRFLADAELDWRFLGHNKVCPFFEIVGMAGVFCQTGLSMVMRDFFGQICPCLSNLT